MEKKYKYFKSTDFMQKCRKFQFNKCKACLRHYVFLQLLLLYFGSYLLWTLCKADFPLNFLSLILLTTNQNYIYIFVEQTISFKRISLSVALRSDLPSFSSPTSFFISFRVFDKDVIKSFCFLFFIH